MTMLQKQKHKQKGMSLQLEKERKSTNIKEPGLYFSPGSRDETIRPPLDFLGARYALTVNWENRQS